MGFRCMLFIFFNHRRALFCVLAIFNSNNDVRDSFFFFYVFQIVGICHKILRWLKDKERAGKVGHKKNPIKSVDKITSRIVGRFWENGRKSSIL